jgi:hypothetical protein
MPGATVLITNNNTGFKREAVTDGIGHFNLADLPAGTYSLKATQQGFRTFEQTQVTVNINTVTRIDVTMEIGAMGDNVTVRAEAPALQTETAEVHSNLLGQELTNLPVPLGGNYQQVYRMLPGFAPPANSQSIPTNPARSLEFSVNGTSDDQNNTRIDGVSTANIQLPHVASYIPTLESIQEVNVVTSSSDAGAGAAGGAAINVQTRSGANAMPDRDSNISQPASESVADAVRRRGVEYRTQTRPELQRVRRDRRRANPEEQGLLLRELRVHLGPQGGEQNRFCAAPAMLKGDLSLSPTYLRSAFWNADGTGRTQFQVFPGDPNYALCNTTTNPSCLNIIPAARMDSIARKIGSYFPANNLNRDRNNYFAQSPFTFDRNQIDSRFDYNGNSKFNMSGTFGMLHYRAVTPTVFGDAGIGRPIGGSSNPGTGHGNTYRVTVMGTYIFSPTFFMDAHYGYARQGTNSSSRGLGQNFGRDTLGIPGTNGTRAFESGWPTFSSADFATIRGQRKLHAVLPARPAVAIRGERQLHQVAAQYPVRRRRLRHGAEPDAGGVHHRRLRRARRIRVRSRRHGTVRGGECRGQLPTDITRILLQQCRCVCDRAGK